MVIESLTTQLYVGIHLSKDCTLHCVCPNLVNYLVISLNLIYLQTTIEITAYTLENGEELTKYKQKIETSNTARPLMVM